MRGQLRELLTGYGNVACIWFDYGYEHKPDVLHSSEIVAEMRSIQPKLLVNDRAGTPEDFGTPEQFVPATGIVNPDGSTRLWEACITMTSRWWGYDAEEKNFKSTTDLIRMLVDVVSKGGNLLLNVGPRPDGTIQPEFVERLQGIGRWMRVHGDAIYGTTASPFRVLPFFGRCTVKGNRLFVHVFAWPADRKLRLPGLLNTIKQASLLPALTSGLPVGHEGRDAIITLPEKPYDEAANVVVLDLDGPPRIEFVAIRPDPQGGIAMPMMSAELRAEFGQKARFETHEGQVHLGYWVRKQDHPAWTFQVDKPGEYSVELVYGAPAGSAGNTVEVAVGDRKVTAKVEPTANPLDFQTRAVGRIACRAGENVLTVRPVGEVKDIVMNLRAAILRPVPPATTSAPTTSPATTRP
jgi:alpha-L-fucosidase